MRQLVRVIFFIALLLGVAPSFAQIVPVSPPKVATNAPVGLDPNLKWQYLRVDQNGNLAVVAVGAFNPVGTWSSSTTYNKNDMVIYSNHNYVSINNGNLNQTPNTSPTQWELLNDVNSGLPYTWSALQTFTAAISVTGGVSTDGVNSSGGIVASEGSFGTTPATTGVVNIPDNGCISAYGALGAGDQCILYLDGVNGINIGNQSGTGVNAVRIPSAYKLLTSYQKLNSQPVITGFPLPYSSAGSYNDPSHVVFDRITLSSGTGNVTLTGSAVFTASTTYKCTMTEASTSANTNNLVYEQFTGSTFTILSSNVSDANKVDYICVGY